MKSTLHWLQYASPDLEFATQFVWILAGLAAASVYFYLKRTVSWASAKDIYRKQGFRLASKNEAPSAFVQNSFQGRLNQYDVVIFDELSLSSSHRYYYRGKTITYAAVRLAKQLPAFQYHSTKPPTQNKKSQLLGSAISSPDCSVSGVRFAKEASRVRENESILLKSLQIHPELRLECHGDALLIWKAGHCVQSAQAAEHFLALTTDVINRMLDGSLITVSESLDKAA